MAQKVKVWNATASYISTQEGIVRPAETAVVEKDSKVSEMIDAGRLVVIEDKKDDDSSSKKQKKKSQIEEEVTISEEITEESVEENIDVPEDIKLPDEG